MNNSDYIPSALWGQDHWSTLAYVETVIVDCHGFQIGLDARMRSTRRNFRVMSEQFRRPKRIGAHPGMAVAMSPQHGTILRDGQVVPGHDDWSCLQDHAEEGLFMNTFYEVVVTAENIEPGNIIQLSPKGRDWCSGLRDHKARGGDFGTFNPSAPVSRAA